MSVVTDFLTGTEIDHSNPSLVLSIIIDLISLAFLSFIKIRVWDLNNIILVCHVKCILDHYTIELFDAVVCNCSSVLIN